MADRHALFVLESMRPHDEYLGRLTTICDMGCGSGEDIAWWATLVDNQDPPQPYNFTCFAVDKDPLKLAQVPKLPNLHTMERDFNNIVMPVDSVDLIWSHDSLNYSTDPIATLKHWHNMMTTDGMLILSIPQHSGVENNRYYSRSYSQCFYHYTPVSLIYMLALNGFDCRDAYLLKQFNDPWIQMAVYKTDVEPMNPETTTWYDLANKNLLHPTAVESIMKHGYLRQEEILYPWLNRNNYFVDQISDFTNLPKAEGPPKIEGVINTRKESDTKTLDQSVPRTKDPKILKPVGIMRMPKKVYKGIDTDKPQSTQ